MSSSKSKKDNTDDSEWRSKKSKTTVAQGNRCIIHNPSHDGDYFTPLNKVRGTVADKLSFLNEIKRRRMNQPVDSPNCLESMSNCLPETINEADTDRVGYHYKCFQIFTMNLHRLSNATSQASSSGLPSL